MLHVPRVEHPDYPRYKHLRTMSKDEMISTFYSLLICVSRIARLQAITGGFVPEAFPPPPPVASDSEDEDVDDGDDDDTSNDDDGDASSIDKMSI